MSYAPFFQAADGVATMYRRVLRTCRLLVGDNNKLRRKWRHWAQEHVERLSCCGILQERFFIP